MPAQLGSVKRVLPAGAARFSFVDGAPASAPSTGCGPPGLGVAGPTGLHVFFGKSFIAMRTLHAPTIVTANRHHQRSTGRVSSWGANLAMS